MGSIISPKLAPKLITFSLVCSFGVVLVTGDNPGFVRTMDRGLPGLNYEQFSYIHVYWHDVVSGPRPTSVPIVASTSNTSATGFGLVSMIDDPLTEGPRLDSKLLGRAQGFYASASQQEVGLLMVMNFAFTEGKYNGSTISILGRNTVFSKVREMPVIGGSGIFRFARGYVQARTYRFDANTGDAVVEYNIYVSHY